MGRKKPPRPNKKASGKDTAEAAEELEGLLGVSDADKLQAVLNQYCNSVKTGFSGRKKSFAIDLLAGDLEKKSDWITSHIRETEWFTDSEGYSRFNGYYDNSGNVYTAVIAIPDGFSQDYKEFSLGGTFTDVNRAELFVSGIKYGDGSGDASDKNTLHISDIIFYK